MSQVERSTDLSQHPLVVVDHVGAFDLGDPAPEAETPGQVEALHHGLGQLDHLVVRVEGREHGHRALVNLLTRQIILSSTCNVE